MLKHELFKNAYEKIFISHREKDADQVAAFVELLHVIGIPRTTVQDSESIIFCTSHPEGYIKNGEQNLDKIRDMITTDKHVFYKGSNVKETNFLQEVCPLSDTRIIQIK